MPDWMRTASHRRRNPLTGQWVLVSPHRTDRPWQGAHSVVPVDPPPRYDPTCYLCPGNARVGGTRNPPYDGAYAFDNDFPALSPDAPSGEGAHRDASDGESLFRVEPARGRCRVVCFSPRHDLHLAALPLERIAAVVDVWADEYARLAALPFIRAVTIFENRGAAMGASNPHPHGQIWATSAIPNEPRAEGTHQAAYRAEHGGACLLCDYVATEVAAEERIVEADEVMVALVPFWAVWPFEVLLLPRRHCGTLGALTTSERSALARAMQRVVARYDRLFATPFPYSMGFHQSPCNDGAHDEWHLHAHYYPPLLRSAEVRKFMVGFEMLGEPQRDLTAEAAAARLRDA